MPTENDLLGGSTTGGGSPNPNPLADFLENWVPQTQGTFQNWLRTFAEGVGNTRVAQADVRTPLMLLLENLLGNQALSTFGKPFGLAQQAQAQPGVGTPAAYSAPNFQGINAPVGTDPLQQAFAQAFGGLFGGGGGQTTAPGVGPTAGPGSPPTSGPPSDPIQWLGQYFASGFPGNRTAPGPGGPPAQSGPATGAPMGSPITPQNYPDLPPPPDPTQLGGGVSLARLLGELSTKVLGGYPTQESLLSAINPQGGYALPQGLQGLGIPDTIQGGLDTLSKLFSAPHLVSPNIDEAQRSQILGQLFSGFPNPAAKGQAVKGFGSYAEQQAPLVESSLGISGNMSLQDIMSKLGFANFMAQGGKLDKKNINIVGEYGPEMIVGDNVIPIGNKPVGLTILGEEEEPQQPNFNFGALPQMPGLPQVGGFQPSTLQGIGTGAAGSFLNQNPEQQAYNLAQQPLQNIAQGGAAGGIMGALQPIFQRNLQFGLGELRNFAPSTANQALQRQGTDLTTQALQDFNLLGAQTGLQGQQNQIGALQTLGGLAGQAGQAPFGQALQAGQLGLQESQAQTGANQARSPSNAWTPAGGRIPAVHPSGNRHGCNCELPQPEP